MPQALFPWERIMRTRAPFPVPASSMLLKGTLFTMSVANLHPQQLWAGYPPLVQV